MNIKIEIGKKLAKVYRAIVKSFDEKTHTATIFISTGDKDRDNEVIEPKAFQARIGNYIAHPVLLSSHRTDTLTRQIGKALTLKITDEGVEGEYEWFVGKGNPEADWGWFLVTRGIAAFSVGFIPHAWLDQWSQPAISAEDTARGISRRFTDVELLENSQVLVPANQNALQRRIGEAQGEEKELCELVAKSIKEDERKPFDKDITPAPPAEDPKAALKLEVEEIVKASLEAQLADKVKELTKDLTAKLDELSDSVKALEDVINNLSPKHYSTLILGGGDDDPGRAPNGKGKEDAGDVVIGTESIAEAVKSGIKEGMTQ